MPAERVLIVGGGVSGLATAYFLSRRGVPSVLLEKLQRTGGLIQTDFIDGCQLEAGPDSYIASKPAVTELAEELPALYGQIMGSNDAARRIFVARDGKLIPMPKGMVMMVPSDEPALRLSPLLSDAAKRRILLETSFTPLDRTEDVSVGRFVSEHFGEEALSYFAEPLLCGVYGGHVEELSAQSVLPRFVQFEKKYGSLIKGVSAERSESSAHGPLFLSLRGGMQSLPDALSAAITGHTVVTTGEASNVKSVGGRWAVAAGNQTLSATHLVLATPAHVSANLLATEAPSLANQLAAIPYSSAILVMLVFDRSAIDHPLDGFGFLVPRPERRVIAASTWINTKFPSRIRPGLVALRAFIVGDQAQALAHLPEAEIVHQVRDDYQRLMGIGAAPLFHTFHSWPMSMPQYVVGHKQRLCNITDALTEHTHLFLAGNAFDGVGIPDCVRRAKEIAQQICAESVN